MWYHKAAEQGNSAAQYHLGIMYMKGLGWYEDFFKAYMWVSIAAETDVENYESIKLLIEKLKDELTERQIKDADRLVNLWHLEHHDENSIR